MEIISKSANETAECAKAAIEQILAEAPTDRAVVVGLSGELGSGKTTFVQAVGTYLGITEAMQSPTFVIEKIYKIDRPPFTHLIHIDAYRLEKGSELLHLGFEEIARDPHNLIFIEWPERVADILPSTLRRISFSHHDNETRKIIFS